jgi:predicted PurR-regulated permease PerM
MEKNQPSLGQVSPTWLENKFFKNTIGILLVLLVIFLFYHVAYLLLPILKFVYILSPPIIISFFIYYLMRPVVHFLEDYCHIPRTPGIIAIYFFSAIFFIFIFAYIGPILAEQVKSLADTSVDSWGKIRETSEKIAYNTFGLRLDLEIGQRIIPFLQQITTLLSQNLIDLLGWLTRLAAILAVTPFMVFYLLKDDHQFVSGFLKFFPEDFSVEARKILKNIDSTLSSYIYGLVLVSSTLGLLLLVGYSLIGLNYALILGVFSMIFTTIPFVGPFLAIIPALLIGLSQGPFMAFKVFAVFVIIQQLESNVISPQIIGQRLHLHPLSIILLLLVAGSLYGLLGLLLATPFYAVFKVIIGNIYKIYRIRYPSK